MAHSSGILHKAVAVREGATFVVPATSSCAAVRERSSRSAGCCTTPWTFSFTSPPGWTGRRRRAGGIPRWRRASPEPPHLAIYRSGPSGGDGDPGLASVGVRPHDRDGEREVEDRKSTRLNSSH